MKAHIEFFGLPGSGKTTLYRAFLQGGRVQKKKAYSLDEAFYQGMRRTNQVKFLKLMTSLLPFHIGHRLLGRFPKTCDDLLYQSFQAFVARHRELSQIILRYQCESAKNSEDVGLMTFLWVLELFSKYQFIHETLPDESSLVLDEGFCQRIISLFAYTEINSQALECSIVEYLDSIPLPTILVVLLPPVELVEERMEKRGWPLRMKRMSHSRRARFFTRARDCIDIALAYLQQHDIDIITIHNTQDTTECLRKIPEIFQALRSGNPARSLS